MIYGVVADLHCHAWSAFSRPNSKGINSRLEIICNELYRVATEVKAAGGDRLIIAGDIFHTRGTIDPEVLNPVRDTFRFILELGVNINIIPGNHDLKSDETKRLSSAVENLNDVNRNGVCVKVYNTVFSDSYSNFEFVFVPWQSNPQSVIEALRVVATHTDVYTTDVFIHAGIDGVIAGMPGHGLDPIELAGLGFRNIFAGHYHNHKRFPGNVTSIGAIAHHNWGDIGSKAGYLLVDSDTGEFEFRASHAPEFVDITGMNDIDAEIVADGNYVRIRGDALSRADIDATRKKIESWRSKGVSIEIPLLAPTVRVTAGPTKAKTLDQSVSDYVKDAFKGDLLKDEIEKTALQVLQDTMSAHE